MQIGILIYAVKSKNWDCLNILLAGMYLIYFSIDYVAGIAGEMLNKGEKWADGQQCWEENGEKKICYFLAAYAPLCRGLHSSWPLHHENF